MIKFDSMGTKVRCTNNKNEVKMMPRHIMERHPHGFKGWVVDEEDPELKSKIEDLTSDLSGESKEVDVEEDIVKDVDGFDFDNETVPNGIKYIVDLMSQGASVDDIKNLTEGVEKKGIINYVNNLL